MSKYYDDIDDINGKVEDILSSIRALRTDKNKIRIYGEFMTIDDARKNYPDEYEEYIKSQIRQKNMMYKRGSLNELKKEWNKKNFLNTLGLHEASPLEIKKLHVKHGDIVGELGDGDIKIVLRRNGLFNTSVYDDIKKCKWIMSIDSKTNIDGELFEGLFDPKYDFSKSKFVQGCYESYSQNKSKFTVGFQDDFQLYTFVHILNLIVQKENSANTFKQRIHCSSAVVNPSYDRPDSDDIQVPETPNNGR